jgi:hypothetical protein
MTRQALQFIFTHSKIINSIEAALPFPYCNGFGIMDVHCTTCGEPWDVYHLRHDAIYETDLSHAALAAWRLNRLFPALWDCGKFFRRYYFPVST